MIFLRGVRDRFGNNNNIIRYPPVCHPEGGARWFLLTYLLTYSNTELGENFRRCGECSVLTRVVESNNRVASATFGYLTYIPSIWRCEDARDMSIYQPTRMDVYFPQLLLRVFLLLTEARDGRYSNRIYSRRADIDGNEPQAGVHFSATSSTRPASGRTKETVATRSLRSFSLGKTPDSRTEIGGSANFIIFTRRLYASTPPPSRGALVSFLSITTDVVQGAPGEARIVGKTYR